jgi:ElaB/YqjD/DUF883 family membrane-anchored ribosome-binding protein
MTNSTTGQDPQTGNAAHEYARSAQNALASGEEIVRQAIVSNPGMALAISAAIGVFLACLIKRR